MVRYVLRRYHPAPRQRDGDPSRSQPPVAQGERRTATSDRSGGPSLITTPPAPTAVAELFPELTPLRGGHAL